MKQLRRVGFLLYPGAAKVPGNLGNGTKKTESNNMNLARKRTTFSHFVRRPNEQRLCQLRLGLVNVSI